MTLPKPMELQVRDVSRRSLPFWQSHLNSLPTIPANPARVATLGLQLICGNLHGAACIREQARAEATHFNLAFSPGDRIHRNSDRKSTSVDGRDLIGRPVNHSYRGAGDVDLVGHGIDRKGGRSTTSGDRRRNGLRLPFLLWMSVLRESTCGQHQGEREKTQPPETGAHLPSLSLRRERRLIHSCDKLERTPLNNSVSTADVYGIAFQRKFSTSMRSVV